MYCRSRIISEASACSPDGFWTTSKAFSQHFRPLEYAIALVSCSSSGCLRSEKRQEFRVVAGRNALATLTTLENYSTLIITRRYAYRLGLPLSLSSKTTCKVLPPAFDGIITVAAAEMPSILTLPL